MPNTRSHVLATPIPTNFIVQAQPDSVPIASDVSAPTPPGVIPIRSNPITQPLPGVLSDQTPTPPLPLNLAFDSLTIYWNKAVMTIFKNLRLPNSRCQCRKALDPRIRSAPFLQPICLSCSNSRVKVVLRIKNGNY